MSGARSPIRDTTLVRTVPVIHKHSLVCVTGPEPGSIARSSFAAGPLSLSWLGFGVHVKMGNVCESRQAVVLQRQAGEHSMVLPGIAGRGLMSMDTY